MTAFKRPDQKLAVVLMNRTAEELPVYLRLKGELMPLSVAGDAIVTVLIEEEQKLPEGRFTGGRKTEKAAAIFIR